MDEMRIQLTAVFGIALKVLPRMDSALVDQAKIVIDDSWKPKEPPLQQPDSFP